MADDSNSEFNRLFSSGSFDVTGFDSANNDTSLNNPKMMNTFNNVWKNNFQTALGPLNSAFIDAELSDQDVADGYVLEYNPIGILWRVNAAGIPHPDDSDNYFAT